MDDTTFTPHVAVTGAASGIGREIASEYAAAGSSVTMIDFDETRLTESVSAVEAESSQTRAKIDPVIADLRDTDRLGDIVRSAFASSPVHVWVNAAGVYPAAPLLEMTAHTWDAVQAINVRAPMLLTVEYAKTIIPQVADLPTGYPVVINISSGAALRARAGAAPYSTSKAAVEMVTKATALELGPKGIRVNAVSPGFVEVDSTINRLTDEYVTAVSPNPLGRKGRPSDIARAVRWIASPAAEWITGEILRVDGGSSAGALNLPVHWPSTRTEVDK